MNCIISKSHRLAESPVYSVRDNILYWVDILAFKVFAYDFKTKIIKFIKLKYHPTAIFLTNHPKTILILTIKKIFKTNFVYLKNIFSFSFRSNFRTNDAKAISKSKIIFSIMDKKKNKFGSIYYLDFFKKKIALLANKIKIPNSIAKDKNRTFYADSQNGKIFCLKNKKKIFFNKNNFPNTEPDGSIIDCHGQLLNANYKNSSIDIYDKKGFLLEQINLPCKHPTSLCLAGKRLNQIIVTSAKHKNSKNRYDGSVFILNINHQFKGIAERELHV